MLPDAESPVPLDFDEFALLQSVLERGSAAGWMNVEMLDGYFAALICAPTQLSTGLRFGPVFAVETLGEAGLDDSEVIESLLWRHWRTIEATLECALSAPSLTYVPLLFEDDAGAVAGNDWARGFLRGVADDTAAWQGFERSCPGALDAVRRLADEVLTGPRIAEPERARLIADIPEQLVAAYRHFEPTRG